MEDHLEFLQQLIQRNNKASLQCFLKYCGESKILTKTGQQCSQLVSLLNETVKNREKREFGLVLMEEFLYEFPKPVLNANLISWMDQCVKGISQGEEDVATRSYAVIRKLLSLNDIQQFKKDINLSIIPKLVEYFFKNENQVKVQNNRLEKLKCLAIILRQYGKSCSKYKDRIRNLIFECLESNRIEVHYAGLCYLYLSLIGPASIDQVKHTENWISQTEFLLRALDYRLNSLFENISEISNITNHITNESFEELPEINDKFLLEKMFRMASQFESLAEFLYISCRAKIDCQTPMKVEKILNVACRVLFINAKVLYENKSADSLNLLPQMPTLQKASIRILEAVILSLDFDVFRYVVIPKALLQILSSTFTPVWANDYEKPFSSVRLKAYECLNLWMSTTRMTTIRSEVQKFTNELLNNIISDISKKEETISLNIEVGKSKKHRKKNKNLNIATELPSSSKERTGSNYKTCLAALKIIHPLMEATKFESKECDFKKLVDVIIVLLSTNCKENRSMLYLMDECRLELYRSLLVLTLHNKPQNPSPVTYANKIFQDGSHDPSSEIKILCLMGLLCTDNILHPSAPLEGFVQNSDSLRSFMQKYKLEERPSILEHEIEPEDSDDQQSEQEDQNEVKTSFFEASIANEEESPKEENLDSLPNKKRKLNKIEEKLPEILEVEDSEEETEQVKPTEVIEPQPITEVNDELESEMLGSFVDMV